MNAEVEAVIEAWTAIQNNPHFVLNSPVLAERLDRLVASRSPDPHHVRHSSHKIHSTYLSAYVYAAQCNLPPVTESTALSMVERLWG